LGMEFSYRRESPRGFSETVEAVERSIRASGFDVVKRHDMRTTLAAKGFEIRPLLILEVAIPSPDTPLCKLHVYIENETVWVAVIRPKVLWEVIEGDGADLPEGVEASVRSLVDACVD